MSFWPNLAVLRVGTRLEWASVYAIDSIDRVCYVLCAQFTPWKGWQQVIVANEHSCPNTRHVFELVCSLASKEDEYPR